MAELLCGAAGSSPYLARLITRHHAWLADTATLAPEEVLDAILGSLTTNLESAGNTNEVRSALRQTKGRSALLIALADLGGAWRLHDVTGALTALADRSVEETSKWLLKAEIDQGRLPGQSDPGAGAGYIVLAMGKMGAAELNYSSDIDLIALFDDSAFGPDDLPDVRSRYVHVTRQLVKLLSENTDEGYVFRTDLRLRPSPSTTPVCMARQTAERYYESVGRTWERAAHIKARPLVDRMSGSAYLETLVPFVWRRHLDFAAIDDIHGMLRKIREQRAAFGVTALPGRDIKRDPGGIREIEFFAQTRQLIMGGRDATLRDATTLGALESLNQAGLIDEDTSASLSSAYTDLRTLEHRLQMMEDAQTHTYPSADEHRQRLAMLCGTDDPKTFEATTSQCITHVHSLTETFFRPKAAGPVPDIANDKTDTVLEAFERPEDAARHLVRWRTGEIAATRSERARALYHRLEPTILKGLARATNPDQALAHFDRFLAGLPAGVQVFSLFEQNLQVLELIISICAAAPKLAAYLGRHPNTLDALLDRGFWEPLPGSQALLADFNARLGPEDDYERILDESRRWAREHWFQTGVHVLRDIGDANEAGAAFTRIAETSIAGLLPRVTAAFAQRHGPPPGTGMAVLAMGKLGSGEMTAGSDLDLITIYDADGVESSSGSKPLAPGAYYPRLTQALISALTAPTAEGALYQVDMRLRPSGNQGPVAVSLAAFEGYQRDKAWVWEHLALTRARCIVGPVDLVRKIDAIIVDVLEARAGSPDIMGEAASMRARLIDANRASRKNPWSLKHAAGGLMEIEFLCQTGVLLHNLARHSSAAQALPDLSRAGWISVGDTSVLASAFEAQQALQHIQRVAIDGDIDPSAIGDELGARLVKALKAEDIEDLKTMLQDLQTSAASVAEDVFTRAGSPDPDGTEGD